MPMPMEQKVVSRVHRLDFNAPQAVRKACIQSAFPNRGRLRRSTQLAVVCDIQSIKQLPDSSQGRSFKVYLIRSVSDRPASSLLNKTPQRKWSTSLLYQVRLCLGSIYHNISWLTVNSSLLYMLSRMSRDEYHCLGASFIFEADNWSRA
jgi:hypothetical protein